MQKSQKKGMMFMDKIALIADIHGNLTALEAVLKDIKSRKISHIYCLGDVAIKGCAIS